MRLHPLRAGTVVAVSALAVLAPIVPASAQVCDAYSGTCATPPTSVLPETLTRGSAQVHPAQVSSGAAPTTLPFTGGELVLLSTAGAGALAAGTVLVMAGRRRKAVAGA